MTTIKYPKKLIEVALPLDDINQAGAREKAIRHGHPSTLHIWWARRPLSVARAVIFAQMVNDPGYERSLGRGVNKEKARVERERLFDIIRRLVKWENVTNEAVLSEARAEIWKSWQETCDLNRNHPRATELFNSKALPAFHDPFAGGGALPLEAQRLGLESYASDLNPVAVLINKAMIEIPPCFPGQAPVGPPPAKEEQIRMPQEWVGANGLAEDVRRYGGWVQQEALNRIGHLYPKVDIPQELGGGKTTVIAWLWARTVKSPNPAFSNIEVPLVTSFVLSNKPGKEAWILPIVEGSSYRFEVRTGKPPKNANAGTKASGRGANFLCLLSGTPISGDYIKEEGKNGRIGERLMAIVAEGKMGRLYLSPTAVTLAIAREAVPTWKPDIEFFQQALGFRVGNYGFSKWSDLFNARQLVAMETLASLVSEAMSACRNDAVSAGMPNDEIPLSQGGRGSTAYSQAVGVYLALAVSKTANRANNLSSWMPSVQCPGHLFRRHAIPMCWDYSEANVITGPSGSFSSMVENTADGLEMSNCSMLAGHAIQADARYQEISRSKVISTDPPYYDNIGYADLSDFFYVWLRRSLRNVYPELFASMVVPKDEELVATPSRHGGSLPAEHFFLSGMTEAMHRLAEHANDGFPTTIYYAFKQSDTTDLGTGNTGWETFLEAVLEAGFAITGTWPMNTERENRTRNQGSNALASSIVLVCRKRPVTASTISRREFLRELKEELAEAVDLMIGGSEGISPVAPVDLAQAVIGPGMAIFSKYSAVLEADGSPMTVHTALTLINRMLTEGGDDFDADTQFCLGWFDDQGWAAGEYGKADVLARAKGTSVDHVREAGVVESSSGKVRLLKPVEYSPEWRPENDNNTPVWEALHQLIRELRSVGESAAGALLAGMPQRAEPIRNLAYRLYTLCERKGWAEDARAYNELIASWTGIDAASHDVGHRGSQVNLDI